MTARSTIEDGLEWLSGVVDCLHDDAELIATEFGAQERYATLLVLDEVQQQIRSELRRGSQNRLAIGHRPFRREPAKQLTLRAHPNATMSHLLGFACSARVFGMDVAVSVAPGWAPWLSKLLVPGIAVAEDGVLVTAHQSPIRIEVDDSPRAGQLLGVGVLWLPDGVEPHKLQAIVDTVALPKQGYNGRIHIVFAPQASSRAVISQLNLSRPQDGFALDVLGHTQQFVACEDNAELFEHVRKLGQVALFVGFGKDPLQLESMGCRSRAKIVLSNRSPTSVHGGFSWLDWNTPTALHLLAPRTIVVREDTGSEGIALNGTPRRIRAWLSGLAQTLRHGTDDEDLW